MSDSEWRQNMTRSLEKWGPKTDRRLRMVAIPVNNGDVEDALAEHAALRAEVERLEEKVRRIQSACGLPNPAEACRVVLAIAAEEGK